MDINKIKAGDYQLLALRWDRQTSKTGEPFEFERFERGATISLTQEEARRLVSAGAAVTPGSIEKAEAEKAAKHLQAMLAQVPDEVRAELLAQYGISATDEPGAGGELEETTPPGAPGPAGVPRPAEKGSKAAWVAYAVDQGMEPAAAQKLDRDELVARYPAPGA